MRAGRLRHRLTFEEAARSASATGTGQRTLTWNEVGTRWGAVEPLSVREQQIAAQTQPRATHKITIRNRPPVPTVPAAQLRIRWAKTGQPVRVFHLDGAMNWQERGIETTIMATEVPGGGA